MNKSKYIYIEERNTRSSYGKICMDALFMSLGTKTVIISQYVSIYTVVSKYNFN